MEYKSIPFEVKDLSISKGEAVIRHSVYDSLDLVKDVARKGMFTKSWNETKMSNGNYDINLYVNHDENKAWGIVTNVSEDNYGADTITKAGTHTIGQDAMKMMDEGIARKASFGYVATKANRIKVKDTPARELKEVFHMETSILTKIAAHPKAGVTAVHKSFEGLIMDIKSLSNTEQSFLQGMINNNFGNLQALVNFAATLDVTSDLYMYSQYWIGRLSDSLSDMKSQLRYNQATANYKAVPGLLIDAETKSLLDKMEKFCQNSSASDQTIIDMQADIKAFKDSAVINTADTELIIQQSVSGNEETKGLADALSLLTLKLFEL